MAAGDSESDRTLTRPMKSLGATASRGRAQLFVVHPPPLRRTIRLLDEDVTFGRKAPGIVIDHATISRRHVALRWNGSSFAVEDVGSRNGTRVDGSALVPGALTPLTDGSVVRIGDVLTVFEHATIQSTHDHATRIPGQAAATVALRRALELAAPDPAPVLMIGDTGTGKEYAARELHRLSGRSGPFVAVNCAALSPHLIEGQLFGHVRGAFTGAERDSVGLFRSAHRGTLLLDEIAELTDTLQAKLLRVLQEGEVLPVGATDAVPIDVRVVAATLRPLDQWIDSGKFRRDLHARLANFEIRLAPLRERRADIPIWLETLHAAWYESRERPVPAIAWDVDGLESILVHPLPDNLRGLGRIVHRGGALGELPYRADAGNHASTSARAPSPTSPSPTSPGPSAPKPRRTRPTREALLLALAQNDHSVRGLARHYDCDRRQIYRWLDHYDLRDRIGKG